MMRFFLSILAASFLSSCQYGYTKFDASLAKTNTGSYVSPHRKGDADLRLSYNFDLNQIAYEQPVKKTNKKCNLTWKQHLGTAITSTVFALSNRYLRGNDNEISSALGGTSVAGIILPSIWAFGSHGGSIRDWTSYVVPSFLMESFPIANALDMGSSNGIRRTHKYHNKGNREDDTLQMGLHLLRWQALSMKSLEVNGYGLSKSYHLAPWIGALGYNLGDLMRESISFDHIFPDRNAPLHLGELTFGAAYGYGLAKTLECGK